MVLEPILVCEKYKPKMGRAGEGYELEAFQNLYREDPFYSWLGLDSPLVYTAHKAAGGITSIYRQIGIGCERLFRQILVNELNLSPSDACWSYETPAKSGKPRTLHLDARIPVAAISNARRREIVQDWLERAAASADVSPRVIQALAGIVFEVRQGYKSKDSKRQHADMANAAAAYANTYLPCVAVLSNQIDETIQARYQEEKWVIIKGAVDLHDDLRSTYDFMRDVVGYDLAGFFNRNSGRLKEELGRILHTLLKVN